MPHLEHSGYALQSVEQDDLESPFSKRACGLRDKVQ